MLNSHLANELLFFLGVLYFVDVTTGSESKSGTPSRVFFKLIGENGAHGEVKLGEDFSKGRFVKTTLGRFVKTTLQLINNYNNQLKQGKSFINNDFLKHKQANIKVKSRRFGVISAPFSRQSQ